MTDDNKRMPKTNAISKESGENNMRKVAITKKAPRKPVRPKNKIKRAKKEVSKEVK